MKHRIMQYKDRRSLTVDKERSYIRNAISDYLSDYANFSKTYERLIDQIQFFPDIVHQDIVHNITISKENIHDILKTLTENEKEDILKKVNGKISRRNSEFKLGEELERYLNNIGQKYGIDCVVDEFVREGKDLFGIKVYIGDRGILTEFNGTFAELKKALARELEYEAMDRVTCKFCGREIIRYVALHKLKTCECGARIVVTSYRSTKGNLIYLRKRISFRKEHSMA
ncbi:hypothetical protein [Thermoplasma sp.]|uniref:hypothetical protein n=1 Tax=Thermoplasma sp. TaxID=1973142 RepID=UPI0025D4F24E|nr:hypothetical protein [Thermoplasma sp.]